MQKKWFFKERTHTFSSTMMHRLMFYIEINYYAKGLHKLFYHLLLQHYRRENKCSSFCLRELCGTLCQFVALQKSTLSQYSGFAWRINCSKGAEMTGRSREQVLSSKHNILHMEKKIIKRNYSTKIPIDLDTTRS